MNLGILGSSVNSSNLSVTVSGLIVGASVFIIWIAQTYFHLTITSDQISNVAEQIGEVIATLLTVYGLVRKLIVYIQQQYLLSKNPTTNAAQQ